MSDNLPTTPMTLEERLKDRLRESMGELITDDDLLSYVRKGIDNVFFQPRSTKKGYGYETKKPLIHEMVEKVLSERMEKAVRAWMQENHEEVAKAMNRAIVQGAGMTMIRAITELFETSWRSDITNKLREVTGRTDIYDTFN